VIDQWAALVLLDNDIYQAVASPGFGGKVEGVWGRKSPSGVQGRSPGGGLMAKPPEAEKQVINFVLRTTLVNAYRPFYSSYNYHHVCKLLDFQVVAT